MYTSHILIDLETACSLTAMPTRNSLRGFIGRWTQQIIDRYFNFCRDYILSGVCKKSNQRLTMTDFFQCPAVQRVKATFLFDVDPTPTQPA